MKRLVWMLCCLMGAVGCAHKTSAPAAVVNGQELITSSDESADHRRARIRTELAAAYLQRGQAEVALDEAKLALAASEAYVPAHVVKALAYMALSRPDLARLSLDRALALAPRDLDVLMNDAWWSCGQGLTDAALAGFERALTAGAGGRAWLGQAICSARAGREADPMFARAYALAPRDEQVVTAWAEYASARSDWARVHELLSPFNAGASANAKSLWMQAQAYRKQGQGQMAKALSQRLLAAFPDSPEAQTLRQEQAHD